MTGGRGLGRCRMLKAALLLWKELTDSGTSEWSRARYVNYHSDTVPRLQKVEDNSTTYLIGHNTSYAGIGEEKWKNIRERVVVVPTG